MAQPSETFDSYDSIGNREDLVDTIYNVDPYETPWLTMMGRGKATNTYHEWQIDTLSTGNDNKNVEGDDATNDAVAATTRLGNYTQIADKTIVLSGTVEAVTRAGRKREMAYQLSKKSKELKTDMEYAICGLSNVRVAGNATTARELGSVQSWIYSNVSAGSGATEPTGDGSDTRGDAGSQRAFTEDMLLTVHQSCWDNGGNPDYLMVGSFNKRVVTGFTGNSTRFDKAEEKTLTNTVSVYISDFGELKVVASRHQKSRDAFLIDFDYWKVCYLRPFRTKDLATNGDYERKQLIVEYTLQASNEKSSGIVADLTTS